MTIKIRTMTAEAAAIIIRSRKLRPFFRGIVFFEDGERLFAGRSSEFSLPSDPGATIWAGSLSAAFGAASAEVYLALVFALLSK